MSDTSNYTNDPSNPSQSIGPDGSLRVIFDENTVPITAGLRAHANKALAEATTPGEYSQALADAIQVLFSAVSMMEYNHNQLAVQFAERDER